MRFICKKIITKKDKASLCVQMNKVVRKAKKKEQKKERISGLSISLRKTTPKKQVLVGFN